MTVGTLIAFLMITGMLYPRIESLVTSYIKLQDIKISLSRVMEYYNYGDLEITKTKNEHLNIKNGDIQIKKLCYRYTNELIIKDLSFHIHPKCITVIVGRNGSGKTTLCKLLANFFEPESGVILVDGQDISNVNVKEIRNNIIYQPQDQFLISGSILDNIVCGNAEIDMEQINNAIYKAKVAEFIQSLPNGLNTYIGEITNSVSGGQAQRIALARLYYRKPRIIILDEPTSFIDVAGKTLFNELVTELKQFSTIIIVTHDNGIISSADQIISWMKLYRRRQAKMKKYNGIYLIVGLIAITLLANIIAYPYLPEQVGIQQTMDGKGNYISKLWFVFLIPGIQIIGSIVARLKGRSTKARIILTIFILITDVFLILVNL